MADSAPLTDEAAAVHDVFGQAVDVQIGNGQGLLEIGAAFGLYARCGHFFQAVRYSGGIVRLGKRRKGVGGKQ